MKRLKTDKRHSADAIKSQIDENLKRVYQATLTEDVPDRFMDLLAQLRSKEKETTDTAAQSEDTPS